MALEKTINFFLSSWKNSGLSPKRRWIWRLTRPARFSKTWQVYHTV